MFTTILAISSCITFIEAKSLHFSPIHEEVYYPSFNFSDTFDWSLFKTYAFANHRNVLISPISLKTVLALLYQGAESGTQREFEQVLHFPNKNSVRELYRGMLDSLQDPDVRREHMLQVTSSIFLDQNFKIKPKYENVAKQYFRTELITANFSNQQETSKLINNWVDFYTNKKVQMLIDSDDLKNSVMFIANIILFKGAWLHQFPRNESYLGTFYRSNNYNNIGDINQLRITFMRTRNVFYHGWSKELDCQILRLPYKGDSYSMFILLPNTLGGLPQLIRSLTLSSVSQLRYSLEKRVVDVSLPKFKLKFKTGLAQTLKDYGLKEMFGNTANFSGISGDHISSGDLFVSDIVQTSGIEVDEEGSVVYSITDVSIGNKFGETVERFNATHPFMFFIEGPTGTVLFIGKLDDPVQETVLPLSTYESYFDVAETEVSPNRIAAFPIRSNSLSRHNVSTVLPTEVPMLQPNPFRVADKNDVSYRLSYFDLEILNELGDSTTNVLVSPASIKSVFAILLEGAGGRTATEISEALRINNKQEGFHEILYHLLNGLNMQTPGVTVQNRNGIFTSDKVKLINNFRADAEKFYKAVFKTIDFTNPTNAAEIINDWVSNATNGNINGVVAPQSVDPDTNILVTNALYFKGKWKTAFDPRNTYKKCFKTNNGCITTPFMSVTDFYNYNYVISINAHVVEIPYEDNFSMLVILPSEEGSVRAVIRDLHHSNLLDIISYLKPTELILEIPKFEFEYSTDFVPHLKRLKIREIFGQQANLSGIVQNGGVFVNSVIHKTKIEVDEKGTVAAAATGAIIVPLIGTWSFVVDRPFVFFIYQKPTPNSINIEFEGILQHP